jgi:hypothetical protein
MTFATNPCGTGGGTIKAGYERAVYVGAAAAEALAAEFGTPATAVILAPVIAAGTYDLLHICSSGDPGDPVLTVQDLVYALNPADFVNSGAAWARIQQWFVHMMWPTWCDCTSGTIPPPSVTAPLPIGGTNPGLSTGQANQPCWDVTHSYAVPLLSFDPGPDQSDDMLPHTSKLVISPPYPPPNGQAWKIPPGVTQVTLGIQNVSGNNAATSTVQMGQYPASGVALATQFVVQTPANQSRSQTFTLDPTAVAWNIRCSLDATFTIPQTIVLTVTFACAPADTLQVPCCPPDPLIEQKLNAIIQMLQQLGNRPADTDTYVNGAVHAGLSGNANFTLSKGTIGMQVHVTSDLSHFFTGSQNPPYYFSLGFVTPVAVGAPLRGSRLIYGRQIYPLEPEADQVYLALAPGVTVDVTELKAGIR